MTDGEASVSPMEKLEMADSVEDKLEVWNTGVLRWGLVPGWGLGKARKSGRTWGTSLGGSASSRCRGQDFGSVLNLMTLLWSFTSSSAPHGREPEV